MAQLMGNSVQALDESEQKGMCVCVCPQDSLNGSKGKVEDTESHHSVHDGAQTRPSTRGDTLFNKQKNRCDDSQADPTVLVFSYSAQKTAFSTMPRKMTPAIQNWILSRSFQ
ncbi:hypothetical protein JZ751_011088 [Albula glossodonta]|uniref:Uncharacterized protein n=1 Tax=Albula glossodonta TaxID=121402 RepID=A0A8T2P4A6_9TELE|nr:hypothetical protein JZ751_011088 [Albula glossodonta]